MTSPSRVRILDAGLHLLDRQVVDVHGTAVCKVDDIELSLGPEGVLTVTALLVGPGALGPRVGKGLGRFMVALHQRVGGDMTAAPPRIPIQLVRSIGSDISLLLPASELAVTGLEQWVRSRIIGPVPGSGDA